MNRKIKTILYGFIIICGLSHIIQASQYAPNIYYSNPFKDEPFFSNPAITFSAGFANQAFDRNGKTVPFLQQYGAEDFLQRFVDPLLGPDNLESAGQGHITGNFHFKQYLLAYEQNIYHKLIFGTIISLQDYCVDNISAEFIHTDQPISQDQIVYLEKLNQIIPRTINETGMNTAWIYFGYNEKISDFNHIQALNVLLLASLSTAQAMKFTNESIFQYTCSGNFHHGYPVIGAMTVDINNWFSFGFCGLVEPFQPCTIMIPINRTSENNHLLFSEVTQAKIDQSPFFSGTIYTEFKYNAAGIIGTLGYSYSQYLDSKITTIDKITFPEAHANKSILLDGYTLGSYFLQLDIDTSHNKNKLAPIISLFFSAPIVGTLFPQIYLFGGTCNFQISYEF